ncbi:MAG TPA: hypothetical protein VF759_07515 [Allosphingosinicella sp.]
MKFRPVGSFFEWDEFDVAQARAGVHLIGPEVSDEEFVRSARLLASIPRVKAVEVTAGDSWFGATPAAGQPTGQVAFAGLLRAVRNAGWRVTNVRRRFSPATALRAARRYGRRALGWRNSWFKIVAPEAVAVERHLQRYPQSVDNMVAALAGEPPVMTVEAFVELSKTSISNAMPRDEAAEYLKAMR